MESVLNLMKVGGSLVIVVPKLYCEHLGVKEGDSIIMKDDQGKHGKFVAVWKKEE